MNTNISIPYTQIPSLGALLMKAAIARKPGLKEATPMERIERSITGITIRREALAGFNALCGFGDTAQIPLPYYYAMAQRVQLALLTDPAFPLGIPGLVHIDNTFRQYGQVLADDIFDLTCRVEGNSVTPSGRIIEIATDFYASGNRAVECRSRFLHRSRGHASGSHQKPSVQRLEGEKKTLHLRANAGRRYAKISGDYNPIHLHALTARLFGFRRPIAHGIYMTARVNAALEKSIPFTIKELSIEYKRPVYLPSQVDLVYRLTDDDAQYRFEVRSGAEDQVHMKGYFSAGQKLR